MAPVGLLGVLRTRRRVFGVIASRSAWGRECESSVRGGVDDNGCPAGESHHIWVRNPIGRRNDDFVSLVEQRQEGIKQAMLRAATDNDVVARCINAVHVLHGLRNRVAKRGQFRQRSYIWQRLCRDLGVPPP